MISSGVRPTKPGSAVMSGAEWCCSWTGKPTADGIPITSISDTFPPLCSTESELTPHSLSSSLSLHCTLALTSIHL